MLTITELQEKLKQIDEVSLLEVLEIDAEDLVARFVDKIEAKYDELIEEFTEDMGYVDFMDCAQELDFEE